MFARRILKSSSSLTTQSNFIRTFASTTSLCRSPALSDITPEAVKSFDAKQKEFRERTAAEQNRKKASATETSQSDTTSPSSYSYSIDPLLSVASDSFPSLPPTAPSASTARSPQTSNDFVVGNIGSQGRSYVEPEEEGVKGKGKLSSLIYGTKEGREMDREIEHSFSQVLARGKYVHSIVFHEVKPDKVDEYVELVGSWYPRMAGMPENKVHLVGSWRTEVGDCDTFGKLLFPSLLTTQWH
jgi:hypothetical protein